MVLFQDINEILGQKVDFDACAGGHPAFGLLRLQCESEWDFDPYRGPHPTTQNHFELCREALAIAYQEQVDLFLTPEYAFPLSLVDRLVLGEEKRPSAGKLWCLSCEGESYDGFKERLDRWKRDDVIVVSDAFERVERRQFVNVLLFVFILAESGKLVVVVQLKTIPMRDAVYTHEGAGLCLGNTVYCLGAHQAGQIYGIICSDAMSGEILYDKFFRTENQHAVILHPQLNPSPDHSHMLDLRDSIFKRGLGYQAIYIAANWSRDSTLRISKKNHRSSGSSISLKISNKERSLDKQNLRKGLSFSIQAQDQYSIWQAHPEAHLQKVALKKTFLNKGHIAQGKTEALVVQKLWLSEGLGWSEEEVTLDWALLSAKEWSFDYETLSPEALREIVDWKGFHFHLDQLVSLTEDQARSLSTWNGASLSLDAFGELPASVAHQLGGSKLERLSFNGLEKVSPEAIGELCSWEGHSLHFDGLKEIDKYVAKAFLHWLSEGAKPSLTAKNLSLCGLREIPLPVFKILLKDSLPFVAINLDGLEELSAKHAACIARWPGNSFSLCSVSNLDIETAQNLAQWKGAYLEYQQLKLGIRKLGANTAQKLACWEGAHLYLEKLESIEAGAAEHLSRWPGRFLYLSESMNELEKASRRSGWEIRII